MIHPGIDVHQSGIEGSGLFARIPIAAGTRVWRLDPSDRPISLAALRKLPKHLHRLAYSYRNNTAIITHDGFEYFNHSCDPNTWWLDDETLAASRDIEPGEEVTFDYASSDVHDWWRPKWRCRCGSEHCRTWITGRDCLAPAFQARFQGHLPSWVREFIERRRGARKWVSAGLYTAAEGVRRCKEGLGLSRE